MLEFADSHHIAFNDDLNERSCPLVGEDYRNNLADRTLFKN